jgi:hypothetical protein
MFTIRAKRADVSGGVMDQTMTYHLVFALETFAAFSAWATGNGTVVRSVLGVHIRVGAVLVSRRIHRL